MKRTKRILPLLCALVVLAIPAPVFAEDVVSVGTNFTTMMTSLAGAAAAGFFFGGLIAIGIGHFAQMPRLASSGGMSSIFGVVLGIAQKAYSVLKDTALTLAG